MAKELLEQHARPDQRTKITTSQFGNIPFTGTRRPSTLPLVVSFGFVNKIKQPDLVIKAFAIVTKEMNTARLVFVGPAGKLELAQYRKLARSLGVDKKMDITEAVSDEQYTQWLEQATLAVQLRASSNGESSGTIGECLAAGIPTIITALGPAGLLSNDAVSKVSVDVAPEELAAIMLRILRDPAEQRSLRDHGLQWAHEHSFAAAAATLLQAIGG